MKKFLNYISTHKEISIIIFVILVLIVGRFFNGGSTDTTTTEVTPTVTPKNQAKYKTLVPGQSTLDQLSEQLGDPVSQKTEGDKTTLEYESTNEYRNNQVIVEDQKVELIREMVNTGDNVKADSIINKYGQAPNVLYPTGANSTFNLYVYPDNGIAYLGHTDGTVIEIWYFKPTTIDNFFAKWGLGYNTTPSTQSGGFMPN